METQKRVRFVVIAYAVFSFLWIQASYPLKELAFSITASPEFGTAAQLLALVQGVLMLLESIGGHAMLARPETEQSAYLELMRQRIAS